mmetsp:Transcript_16976/g.16211  ORF Transcript_16976/g.16211 Transcript_16976/m.16211 type:complete len:212 (+) Transcript_16976:1744-2379(+)
MNDLLAVAVDFLLEGSQFSDFKVLDPHEPVGLVAVLDKVYHHHGELHPERLQHEVQDLLAHLIQVLIADERFLLHNRKRAMVIIADEAPLTEGEGPLLGVMVIGAIDDLEVSVQPLRSHLVGVGDVKNLRLLGGDAVFVIEGDTVEGSLLGGGRDVLLDTLVDFQLAKDLLLQVEGVGDRLLLHTVAGVVFLLQDQKRTLISLQPLLLRYC